MSDVSFLCIEKVAKIFTAHQFQDIQNFMFVISYVRLIVVPNTKFELMNLFFWNNQYVVRRQLAGPHGGSGL
jgi:hypothetical protein